MAPIGIDMANSRYTAKKSAMAAMALFVALAAAVPVLANPAHEKVVSRLSTSGEASESPRCKEAMQPGMPASLQVSQELEQGTYQERFIRRLSGESPTGTGRDNSQGKEATPSGTSAFSQESHQLGQGTYQERFIRRLAGESPAGVGRKSLKGEEATQSGTPASLQASQEPEQGTYQERFIRRLAGEPLASARGPK